MKEELVLHYTNKIWEFRFDYRKEGMVAYQTNDLFNEKYQKRYRLILGIDEGEYGVHLYDYWDRMGSEEMKEQFFSTEEEARNFMMSCIEELKTKYQLKELLGK